MGQGEAAQHVLEETSPVLTLLKLHPTCKGNFGLKEVVSFARSINTKKLSFSLAVASQTKKGHQNKVYSQREQRKREYFYHHVSSSFAARPITSSLSGLPVCAPPRAGCDHHHGWDNHITTASHQSEPPPRISAQVWAHAWVLDTDLTPAPSLRWIVAWQADGWSVWQLLLFCCLTDIKTEGWKEKSWKMLLESITYLIWKKLWKVSFWLQILCWKSYRKNIHIRSLPPNLNILQKMVWSGTQKCFEVKVSWRQKSKVALRYLYNLLLSSVIKFTKLASRMLVSNAQFAIQNWQSN